MTGLDGAATEASNFTTIPSDRLPCYSNSQMKMPQIHRTKQRQAIAPGNRFTSGTVFIAVVSLALIGISVVLIASAIRGRASAHGSGDPTWFVFLPLAVLLGVMLLGSLLSMSVRSRPIPETVRSVRLLFSVGGLAALVAAFLQ